MEHYVGLDVSLKLTAICIVDRTGKIEREGVVKRNPTWEREAFIRVPLEVQPHGQLPLGDFGTASWAPAPGTQKPPLVK
jgi:hypothetical protein